MCVCVCVWGGGAICPPPKMKVGLRNRETVRKRFCARTPNFRLETFWRKNIFGPPGRGGPGTSFWKKYRQEWGGILGPLPSKVPVLVPVVVNECLRKMQNYVITHFGKFYKQWKWFGNFKGILVKNKIFFHTNFRKLAKIFEFKYPSQKLVNFVFSLLGG